MWINGLFAVFSFLIFLACSELVKSTAEVLWSRKEQRGSVADHADRSRRLAVTSTRKRHANKKHGAHENDKIRSHGIVHELNAIHDETRKAHAVETRKRARTHKRLHAIVKHAPTAKENTFSTGAGEKRKSKGRGEQVAENTFHKPQKKRKKSQLEGDEEIDVDKIKENNMEKANVKKQVKQQDKMDDSTQLDSNHSDEARKHVKLSKKTLKLFRKALLVHPFQTWKFKDRFRSMDDLGIHEVQLHDIIDNKWNKRLKHKLQKVLHGENIHLAIIGGSNSAGGGIQEDEGGTEGIYFKVISDWWRKTITPITGSHLKLRQVAMGGTASDFFQYCYKAYIQENVDIVLLEMSVNDLKELPPSVNLSLPIEQLTRQLLTFPTQPAVIYVNLLSGRSYYQGCTNLEDFGQHLLSDLYNITTFSWRDAVCPLLDGDFRMPLKTCAVVCKDGHHINQLGHAHISLMIINLLRDLLLDSLVREKKRSREIFNDDTIILPKPVFITSPNKIITSPICWTTISPNYKKFSIQNNIDVGVMENFGFDYLHNAKIGGQCHVARSCRGDAYSGWTGKHVGASLTLSFTVPAFKRKRGLKSRSVVFATRTCGDCGSAEIWMDDDYQNRKFVKAKSLYSQTSIAIIALRVFPGDHIMNIRLIEPGEVTVVGVMLGPPDGPY